DLLAHPAALRAATIAQPAPESRAKHAGREERPGCMGSGPRRHATSESRRATLLEFTRLLYARPLEPLAAAPRGLAARRSAARPRFRRLRHARPLEPRAAASRGLAARGSAARPGGGSPPCPPRRAELSHVRQQQGERGAPWRLATAPLLVRPAAELSHVRQPT